MLYKNYSIWVSKQNLSEGYWKAEIMDSNTLNLKFFEIWWINVYDSSLKSVLELAKMEIELQELRILKQKLNKSVARSLKLDWRNNHHRQT